MFQILGYNSEKAVYLFIYFLPQGAYDLVRQRVGKQTYKIMTIYKCDEQ